MDLISVVQSVTILGIFKVMLIILLGVYALFAGLMMKQIGAMTRAVTMKDDFIIRILGIVNFGLALFVLFIAIIIL